MNILEKDIENKVREWALARNFLVSKVQFTENGWPDRLFISPNGVHIWVEFKRPGEKPRPLQMHRILDLKRKGVPALWVDNYDDAIKELSKYLDSTRVPTQGGSVTGKSGGFRSAT